MCVYVCVRARVHVRVISRGTFGIRQIQRRRSEVRYDPNAAGGSRARQSLIESHGQGRVSWAGHSLMGKGNSKDGVAWVEGLGWCVCGTSHQGKTGY